jgi:hypothetical protein
MGGGRLEVNGHASPVGVRLEDEWPCARVEGRVRAGVRSAFRAYICRLGPPVRWPEFRRAGPGPGLVAGRRWVLGPLLGLPTGAQVGLPDAGVRAVTGSSWPRQLLGAGPWRHPGVGEATPGSPRRPHEEIVDGDAGMIALTVICPGQRLAN